MPRTAYTGAYTVSGPAAWSPGLAGVTMQVVAESYYAERSARDPEWRLRAIAAAAERYRRARDADRERVLGHSRAYRSRLRRESLTMAQLRARARIAHGDADDETLRRILRQEVAAGRVDLVQRRYRLNGGLPDDVKHALRDLEL
jgi:hypothetical protein